MGVAPGAARRAKLSVRTEMPKRAKLEFAAESVETDAVSAVRPASAGGRPAPGPSRSRKGIVKVGSVLRWTPWFTFVQLCCGHASPV